MTERSVEPTPSFSLCLVTDPSLGDVVDKTRAALAAAPPGSVAVQVRDPSAGARELLALARALSPICRAAGAPMMVNDRVDVAMRAGADGVHLPERGIEVADARALLGAGALIGRSCHDRPGLERAAADGASFAVFGPIAEVPSKGAPLGVDGFSAAIDGIDLPVYALGGVDAGLATRLRRAGAAGVAVVRAVYATSDPGAAVEALRPARRTR